MRSQKSPQYNLNWLVSPDVPGATIGDESSDVERIDYTLPPSLGVAWVEKLQLDDGICLYHACHFLEQAPSQLLPLFDVDISPPEPIFCAQIWLSGTACHREYWPGREHPPVDLLARPGRDTFRYHRDWHATILIEGGVVSEMKSVIVPEPSFFMLLGETPARFLLSQLGLGADRCSAVRSVLPHVGMPLRVAMDSRFHGPARKLYAQAKVLEYLAGLYEFVSQGETPKKERQHGARIRELHEYLTTLEGRIPTLDELSENFGLSARRLNAEFAAEYGKSIFGFVTDYRLDQAYASLKETDLPMKTLAKRLGYSHVNHFITAFKRKFGFPPGTLRKRVEAQ